ncbi:MAG TPA: nitrogen regulation protein NR(II) [Gammaproteobacteria bacterium]|jgi:two-component system nitrogen regulation sensor histidine kinase GlnL|nr:nitrogen regulation protein NR(II) [Gammaproteobacteria bacterium]
MPAKYANKIGHELVLDNLSTAVMVFDEQFRLRYINQAGEVMLAHSARHACDRSVHELVVNSEALQEQLAKTITSGQVIVQRGCQLELADAMTLRVNCTFTPVFDETMGTHVLIEMRQIDHQMRVEQDELLIDQQQATRLLVRGLAHEIKNPLGGLRGAAQLLEREISAPELLEYTQIIIGEADRLQALIDRMLGPSALPQLRQLNIHEVLERVRGLVRAEVGNELVFVQDYDPSLPELHADPDQLEQAVLNIVRNATQAMQGKGTITLRTRVLRNFNIGARKYRLVVQINIIDTGPGIEEELQKKIFFPMVTTRSEGTGLGLSIAQALVSRHEGLIECQSEPGETTFTILLPLGKRDDA